MTIEDIDIILKKYNNEEILINNTLEQCDVKWKEEISNFSESISNDVLTFEKAIKRNKEILNEFDVVKGNLRSKAIFSPTELHWDQICMNYRNDPSLPVSTWRCHLPVFV